jgi:hypothetical protein
MNALRLGSLSLLELFSSLNEDARPPNKSLEAGEIEFLASLDLKISSLLFLEVDFLLPFCLSNFELEVELEIELDPVELVLISSCTCNNLFL